MLLRYVNEVPVSVISNLLGISRFSVYRKALSAVKILKSGFEPPVAQKKDLFLAQVETPPISFLQFLTLQLGHIRKWIWIFFISSFLIMLIGTAYLKKSILWDVSAFTPLLALFLITETQRSEFYGTSEFELSTRFSLKSIVLARLGIMGLSTLTYD